MARIATALALLAMLALAQAHKTPKSTNPKVTRVVVLVLENRSFDHMLGFMHGNNTEIDGCTTARAKTDPACNCPLDPTVPNSPTIPVDNEAVYVQPADPQHDFVPTQDQVYGYAPVDTSKPAPMTGFIKNYASVMGNTTGGEWIMKMFAPEHVPVITTLASEYAVIDHWYSGIPGPTEVNRAFQLSATSHGYTKNREIIDHLGLPQRTIFESMEDAGASWGVYFNDFPSSLLFQWTWGHLDKFHSFDKFLEDTASGDLPAFSWVEPRYYDDFGKAAQDEHPDHDVAEGEALIRTVYDALRASPTWNETLLLVTYDEHGGFFDHVPPPVHVPNPDGLVSADPAFNFTRLGVRVPAVVVSPWINKNTVVHGPTTGTEFSHSSIPATVRKLFAPDQSFLTHRDAWSAPFDALLTRDTIRTDCPETMPTAPLHRQLFDYLGPLDGQMPLTELQKTFMKMAAIGVGDESVTDKALDGMTEGEGSRYVISAINKAAGRTVVEPHW